MTDTADELIEEGPEPELKIVWRSGYYDGLAERSRRLRLVENDVTSLRTAVLMLCAAVAVLAYLVMREDRHAV